MRVLVPLLEFNQDVFCGPELDPSGGHHSVPNERATAGPYDEVRVGEQRCRRQRWVR
jgi:hypothetical protein